MRNALQTQTLKQITAGDDGAMVAYGKKAYKSTASSSSTSCAAAATASKSSSATASSSKCMSPVEKAADAKPSIMRFFVSGKAGR